MVGLLKGSEITRFALPAPDTVASRPAAAATAETRTQPLDDPSDPPRPHAETHFSAHQQSSSFPMDAAAGASSGGTLSALGGENVAFTPQPARGSHGGLMQSSTRSSAALPDELGGSSISLPAPPRHGDGGSTQPPAAWNQRQGETPQAKTEQDLQVADNSSPSQRPVEAPQAEAKQDRQAVHELPHISSPFQPSEAAPSEAAVSEHPVQQTDEHQHGSSSANSLAERTEPAANESPSEATRPVAQQDGLSTHEPIVGLQSDTTSSLNSPLNMPEGTLLGSPSTGKRSATAPNQQSQVKSSPQAASDGLQSTSGVPAVAGSGSQANRARTPADEMAAAKLFPRHADTAAEQAGVSPGAQTHPAGHSQPGPEKSRPLHSAAPAASDAHEHDGLQFSDLDQAEPNALQHDHASPSPPADSSPAGDAPSESKPSGSGRLAHEASDAGSRSLTNAAPTSGQLQSASTSGGTVATPILHGAAGSGLSASSDSTSRVSDASRALPDVIMHSSSRQTAGQGTRASPPGPAAQSALTAAVQDQQTQQQQQQQQQQLPQGSVAQIRQAFSGSQSGGDPPQTSGTIRSSPSGNTPEAVSSDLDRLRNPFGFRPSAATAQAPAVHLQAERSEASPVSGLQQPLQSSHAGPGPAGGLQPASSPLKADMMRPGNAASVPQISTPAQTDAASSQIPSTQHPTKSGESASTATPSQSVSGRSAGAAAASDAAAEQLRRLRDPFGRMQRASNGAPNASASAAAAGQTEGGGVARTPSVQSREPLHATGPASRSSINPTESGKMASTARPASSRAVGTRNNALRPSMAEGAGPLQPMPGAKPGQNSMATRPVSMQQGDQQQTSLPGKLSSTPSGHLQRSLTDFNPLG